MTAPSSVPAAPHNPARLTWEGVPDHVRDRVAALARADVVGATTATAGFSPGYAGVVELAGGGRVFVKAMSDADHAGSIWLNRAEAKVVRVLPAGTPAARLQWEDEFDGWHLLGFDALPGGPLDPGDAAHRRAARALTDSVGAIDASNVRVDGAPLEPFAQALADLFPRWSQLFDAENVDARFAAAGPHEAWVPANASLLTDLAASAPAHTKGSRLVHADLRMDNMVLDATGRAVAVDWPWACIGAPWLDALAGAVSLSLQSGLPARELFLSHAVARDCSPQSEIAMVAVLAGYFLHAGTEPDVPALPGLREFQRAQARPALDWLRSLVDGHHTLS